MTRKIENIQEFWNKFKSDPNQADKEKLMLNYIWLVKYVIQQMNLPVNSVLDEEDYLNIGFLGLNESIDRYDPERGVKFESYAVPRIRGMIQDELRKLDWLSRTARKKAHDLMQMTDTLRSKKGREISPEEVRKALGLSHDKYQSYLDAAAAAKASLSMGETHIIQNDEDESIDILQEIPDDTQKSFIEKFENEETIQIITDMLQKIPEKKRLVMMLYYYEELTFKDIGKVLNVSESRVCQIHTQVIGDLRKKIMEYENA